LIHQYFLEEDDPGGSRFNEMVEEWIRMGNSATVISGMIHANGTEKRQEYKGLWWKEKKQGEIKVIRCHVAESYNTNFIGRLWGYFSFVISSTLAVLFKAKSKYDLVLVTSPPLFVAVVGIFTSFVKRIPLIFEIRDLWPESAIDTGVLKNQHLISLAFFVERIVYKKSKAINVLTPAFHKKLIEEKGVHENKLLFIPNAADFSISEKVLDTFDFVAYRDKLGLSDKFVITYVGAHGVANHLYQLLDAAELLIDTNIVFQLIGSGMEKERLMEYAKDKKLKNIIFRDPVPKYKVFEYIISSDMGASVLKNVNTFRTIYSNKTFDYMSCKIPVFLCIDGVSRDLISKANCGVFAIPENVEDIAEKARFCSRLNKDYLKELGENGYKYAKKHFDRKKLARDYLQKLAKYV
jgi:glycosyltransferase involved in cell wall biosynthesis